MKPWLQQMYEDNRRYNFAHWVEMKNPNTWAGYQYFKNEVGNIEKIKKEREDMLKYNGNEIGEEYIRDIMGEPCLVVERRFDMPDCYDAGSHTYGLRFAEAVMNIEQGILSKWGINPKRLRYITGLDTEYVGSHKIYIVSGFITLRDLKGGLLGSCDNTSRHLRGHSVDIKIFHDPIKQSITNGHFDSRANVFVEGKPNMFGRIDMPKKIINSGPATVCIWKEKEKTVSMCMPGETKDPLYGFLMCFFKRYCGMKPRQMKKWLNKKVGSNFKGV